MVCRRYQERSSQLERTGGACGVSHLAGVNAGFRLDRSSSGATLGPTLLSSALDTFPFPCLPVPVLPASCSSLVSHNPISFFSLGSEPCVSGFQNSTFSGRQCTNESPRSTLPPLIEVFASGFPTFAFHSPCGVTVKTERQFGGVSLFATVSCASSFSKILITASVRLSSFPSVGTRNVDSCPLEWKSGHLCQLSLSGRNDLPRLNLSAKSAEAKNALRVNSAGEHPS